MTKTPMNCVYNFGGLGDNICRMPATRYLLDNVKHILPTFYIPAYFIEMFKHLVKPWAPPIIPLHEFKQEFKRYAPTVDFNPLIHTSMHRHLIDHAFDCILDLDSRWLDPKHRHYPQPEAITSKPLKTQLGGADYVVFTPNYTHSNRELRSEALHRLTTQCYEAGYIPVLLGSTTLNYDGVERSYGYSQYKTGRSQDDILDLRNKTSLLEALQIMRAARAVVGVDNGLLHLAGCTAVPIIAGYTTVDPKHRVPIRPEGVTEIVTPEGLDCAGCQSNWLYTWTGARRSHDFKRCFYSDNVALKNKCTKLLTAEKFWSKLKKYL